MVTFWYTNAVPQYGNTNVGKWRSLEDKIEKFGVNKILYIITGVSSNTHLDTDYSPHIKVPDVIWNLVCAKNNGTEII